MSSSEEYLDSLLDSILGGGKPEEEEKTASGTERENSQASPADGGKAMSPEEIEEMLVSMGTLGGAEETQEQAEEETEAEEVDMDSMIAFMNERNASASASETQDTEVADSVPEEPDMFSLDDLDLEESGGEETATDEVSLDDLPLDGLSLDDLDLGESGGEEAATDEVSLDDLSLDGLSLDDLDLGESGGEEAAMDEVSMDDLSLDGLSLDDLDLGESGGEEAAMDEVSMDDLSLDGLSLDDLDLGESGSEETTADDFSMDGLSLDDLSLDDLGMGEETASDDLSLDDMSLGETEAGDGEDGLMSEEDIDRLLNGELSDGGGAADDFALEDIGESDEDLSSLLAGMDHDEDLSEINDLLEGADQGVSPDDDILAMLEGADGGGDSSFDFFESDEAAKEAESIRELTPEEIAEREGGGKPKKEKKSRKKLFGKKKNSEEVPAGEETGDELAALLGGDTEEEPAAEEKEKKPGVFARIMNFLLESDEEDEDPVAAEVLADGAGETGTVTEENKELLEELKEEDKKGKKKKKKDKKKGKKGKEAEGEEGEEAAEGEEEPKKEKKKKKKEKKKKEEEEVDLFAPPEKKLSKKKVITVFVFCGTVAACIVLLSSFLPNYSEKRSAHVAYDHRDYAGVFDLLYGKKLNEEEEILFRRSNLILQMNRKLASYENYVNLDMRLEALNALVSGVARYQEILPEAETYNVVGEVSDIYAQILERLSADFGVSESDVLDIIASEDDVTYTQKLEAVLNGGLYGEEDIPEGRQDVLPEEEEIIERIDGLADENTGEGAE